MYYAVTFINFHNELFDYSQGDEVAMRNWLRCKKQFLGGPSLLLMTIY